MRSHLVDSEAFHMVMLLMDGVLLVVQDKSRRPVVSSQVEDGRTVCSIVALAASYNEVIV